MKFFARLLPALFIVLTLAGCYFDHPLTDRPSKDMNTWLLGVWESKDEKGRVSRVRVTPENADHYSVQLAVTGKNPQDIKRYGFLAWPSRVGDTLFLNLRCLTSPGDIPVGSFVFSQIQLLDQNDMRTHGLNLDSQPSASSYDLRKEIRSKIKDRSIYEGAPSVVWTRVEDVFWSTNGADPAFPPRNPNNFAWGPNDDIKNRNRKLFGNSSND